MYIFCIKILSTGPKFLFIRLLFLTELSYDTYWPERMKFVYQLLSYHIEAVFFPFHPCYSRSCFIFIHSWIQSQQLFMHCWWFVMTVQILFLHFAVLSWLQCSGCDRHVFEFGVWCCASSRDSWVWTFLFVQLYLFSWTGISECVCDSSHWTVLLIQAPLRL